MGNVSRIVILGLIVSLAIGGGPLHASVMALPMASVAETGAAQAEHEATPKDECPHQRGDASRTTGPSSDGQRACCGQECQCACGGLTLLLSQPFQSLPAPDPACPRSAAVPHIPSFHGDGPLRPPRS